MADCERRGLAEALEVVDSESESVGRVDGVRDSRGENEALPVRELQGDAEKDKKEVRDASEENVKRVEAEP